MSKYEIVSAPKRIPRFLTGGFRLFISAFKIGFVQSELKMIQMAKVSKKGME